MTPRPDLSVIEFTGGSACSFLHRQLSSDVQNVPVGGSVFGAVCNPAGRVLALLLLKVEEDRICALCARSLAPGVVRWLQRFILRDDVTISHRSEATVTAFTADDGDLPGPGWRAPGGLGYTVGDPDKAGSPPVDWVRAAEMEQGIVWLDQDSSGEFLPQMLGHGSIGALDFKKGCYPGQEVIARTHYLGKLKRRPLLIRVANGPRPASMSKVTLTGEQESWSGVCVDHAVNASGETLMFVVARATEAPQVSAIELDGQRYSVVS